MYIGMMVVNEFGHCIWWKLVHPMVVNHLREDPMMPQDHFKIPDHILANPGFYTIKGNFETWDDGDYVFSNLKFELEWP